MNIASDPISLKRIQKMWSHLLGIDYKSHWTLKQNGQQIADSDDIDIILTDTSDYECTFDFRIDEIATSIKNNMSDIRETNILNKIVSLTEGQIQFNEDMNIYSLGETSQLGSYNVEKIPWQNNTEKTFFIDSDEDPFNDSMVLFEKTSANKFQLSKIVCRPPAFNSSLKPHTLEKNSLNLILKKQGSPLHMSTVASGFEGECYVEPLDLSQTSL